MPSGHSRRVADVSRSDVAGRTIASARRSPSLMISDRRCRRCARARRCAARPRERCRSPCRRSRRRGRSATPVGATRSRMAPGATSGRSLGVGDLADGAQRRAVRVVELEALGDGRGDGQRRWPAAQASPGRSPSAPLAAMRSASALRAIRLSIARAARAPGRRARRASARCRFADARSREPDQSAAPIGSSAAVRISSSLAAVGSAAKRCASAAHHALQSVATASAELAEQIEEIVGNGFAQRVVIDGAEARARDRRRAACRLFLSSDASLRSPPCLLRRPSAACSACHSTSRPPLRGCKRASLTSSTLRRNGSATGSRAG